MKFNIDREVLLEALSIIKPAVPIKATNNVLKTVYMEAKDNTLYLRGTDRRTDIVVIVPCEIEKEGRVCADHLVVDLIPNLGAGDITFDFKEWLVKESPPEFQHKLSISQGKRLHEVAHYDSAEYPKRKKIKKYQTVDNPGELAQVFAKAGITLSNLSNRRYLQGFYINPLDGYLVTGDGNRVTTIENLDLPGNISLPKGQAIMSVLPTILNSSGKSTIEAFFGKRSGLKVTRYNDKDEFVMMVEAIFSSLSGEYPDQARQFIIDALKVEPKLELEVSQSILKNILEIAKMYSDRAALEKKAGSVILKKLGDQISLKMKIKGLVEMDEPLECEFKGEGNFEIWFHPGLLLEGVSAIESDTVKLLFYGNKLSGQKEDLPFVMLDPDMENYTYLQTLMAMPEKIKEIKQSE